METNTPSQRVTVTLPQPLPSGIYAFLKYPDGEGPTSWYVYIAFVRPFSGDDDVFATYDLEDIDALFKAIDAGEDVYTDVSDEWGIDLTQPYKFIYE